MTKKSKIVFAVLLTFLLLPNLMGVFIATDLLTIGQRILYILTSFAIYALGLSIFKMRTFFYVASSWFLLSAIEIVHLIINSATTSMLFIFTCIKSEKGEFFELLSTYWFVVVLFFIIWGVYYYLNHRFIPKEYIAPHKPRMIALIAIVVFFVLSTTMLALRPKFRNLFDFREQDYRTAAWVGCEKACPINMGLGLYHIVSLALEIRSNEKALADFRFGVTHSTDDSKPIILFLIGETSRYDHWQINGYDRPTSPNLMRRRDEILSFDSCYSIANLTTVSVPYMLSRATPENPRLYYQEPSVVDAFHEAGYHTAWIADQSFNNEFLMRIANGCDFAKYVTDDGSQPHFIDTVLLAPLRQTLKNENPGLIVLHSLGCHFKYSERYPDEFQFYTPDMKGINIREMFNAVDNDAEGIARLKPENMAIYHNLKSILVNSYDNAITFTDYFIELVIRELEATNRPAILIYVGDHGENLLDDDRNMFLHGTYGGSEYEYHVPLFVWTSQQYEQTHEEKIQAMCDNTKKCFSTMTLFHSLLDLGDISYSQLDSTMSIANPALRTDSIVYGLDANMLCTTLPISHNQ